MEVERSEISAASPSHQTPKLAHMSSHKSSGQAAIFTCNCKKSKCLKLYCDCFAQGRVCGPECNCVGCCNLDDNEERQAAVDNIMERNPSAFKPKID